MAVASQAEPHGLQRDGTPRGERRSRTFRGAAAVGLADLLAEPGRASRRSRSPRPQCRMPPSVSSFSRSTICPPGIFFFSIFLTPCRRSSRTIPRRASGRARVRQQAWRSGPPGTPPVPPRRPDVQGRNVAVADVLLVNAVQEACLERKANSIRRGVSRHDIPESWVVERNEFRFGGSRGTE